eukprot:CFRG1440T1
MYPPQFTHPANSAQLTHPPPSQSPNHPPVKPNRMASVMFARLTPVCRMGAIYTKPAFASQTMLARGFHAAPSVMKAATTATSSGGMKESSHWKAERVMTVGSLALIPTAMVVGPSMPVDMAMAVVLPLHSYWGMDQVFTDYAKGVFAPLSKMINIIAHLGTVGGLIYFNMNDVGITKAVQMLWEL